MQNTLLVMTMKQTAEVSYGAWVATLAEPCNYLGVNHHHSYVHCLTPHVSGGYCFFFSLLAQLIPSKSQPDIYLQVKPDIYLQVKLQSFCLFPLNNILAA